MCEMNRGLLHFLWLLLLHASTFIGTELKWKAVETFCWLNIWLLSLVVAAPAFNPNTQAEIDRSVSSRPTWTRERVPGQSGLLHRETLSQKTKPKKQTFPIGPDFCVHIYHCFSLQHLELSPGLNSTQSHTPCLSDRLAQWFWISLML